MQHHSTALLAIAHPHGCLQLLLLTCWWPLFCSGVLEGIRVSRAAYPNRLPHGDFLHRFGVLLPLASSLRTDIRAAIQALLPAAAKDKARCQVGKTR